MPKHLNINQSVFGGDVLVWMEKVALACARRFLKNNNVATIMMNRIFFKKPLYITDFLDMKARVVYVRKFSLEVEIDVSIERKDGQQVSSHTGYFTMIQFNNVFFRSDILQGLKLANESQDNLKRFLKAKERYLFRKTHEPKRIISKHMNVLDIDDDE